MLRRFPGNLLFLTVENGSFSSLGTLLDCQKFTLKFVIYFGEERQVRLWTVSERTRACLVTMDSEDFSTEPEQGIIGKLN